MSDISRRNLIRASVGVAGALILPKASEAVEEKVVSSGGLVTGQANPLPYKSIPGFLSEAQIRPHHSAHYGGALKGYLAADKKLHQGIIEGVAMDASAYGATQRARTNKANSVLLHELYFDGMAAKTSIPTGEISEAIKKRFGSVDKWAEDFQASAKAASGWAVLALNSVNGTLYNVVCDKHATGIFWMSTPLLVIDVYEHAYYIDYQNNKMEYIKKFMEHINWEQVNQRFKNR